MNTAAIFLLLVFVGIVFLSCESKAELPKDSTWEPVPNKWKKNYFYDAANITYDDETGVVRVWDKSVENLTISGTDKGIRAMYTLYEIDCSEKIFYEVAGVIETLDGETDGSLNDGKYPPAPIKYGTLQEPLYDMVCSE